MMEQVGDKDRLPADYLNFYSISGVIEKEDEEAFERFCDYRASTRTVRVFGALIFAATTYTFAMSLINPKSYCFLLVVVGFGYFVRNPLAVLVVYFRDRMQNDKPVPSCVNSLAPYFPAVLNLLAVYSSLGFSLFLMARVLNGRCESLDQLHMWSCNSEYDAHALPQELVVGLMFLPLVFSIAFKALRSEYVLLSWFISVAGIIAAIVVGDAHQSIPTLVIYLPMSLLFLYEVHRQKVVLFLLLKKQQSLMDANKHLAEESQNELRFMIANMAHDLKTPLSAFMNGVETLKSSFQEIETSTAAMKCPQLEHAKESLTNLQTVNNFMTMTVNRCIDYMKASKGIKLEPRLETINLQEVLSMPLNCMRDLQSRIAITQKPISRGVCSHIITDLQWFQENLFCLISNAVKYSSHGSIRVSVTLTNESNTLICGARRKKTQVMSPRTELNRVQSFSVSGHENYTFLDRLFHRRSSLTPTASGIEGSLDGEDIERGLAKIESPGRRSSTSTHRKMSESALSGYLQSLLKRQHSGKVYVIPPKQNEKEVVHSTTTETSLLMIEVEDTGIGLSDEAKEKLFTPFKQAQRRAGGTGLGLYSLAKRVDALGGYYGVSNRRDGEQGSIFWFAIPYRPDHSLSAVKTSLRKSMMISDVPIDTLNNDKIVFIPEAKLMDTPTPLGLTPPSGKLRILLVDDSLPILKMTSNLLKRHGHVVDQEENGADALARLDRVRGSDTVYDVMLIDLNMPVMDGLEAMKRLRETERQLNRATGVIYHQRVFAFSANSDTIALTEAIEAGADDFICKPFTIQTFNEKMERWVLMDV